MTSTDSKFNKVRKSLKEAIRLHDTVVALGEIMTDRNQEVTDKLNETATNVDELQATVKTAYQSYETLIADLRRQLESGPPGLTDEQVTAALSKMTEINADLKSTITT